MKDKDIKILERDNLPLKNQVETLSEFLLNNFQDEFGAGKGRGERAIEMAIRLLGKLKQKKKIFHWVEEYPKNYITIGRNAPWLNKIWIRVPKFVVRFF